PPLRAGLTEDSARKAARRLRSLLGTDVGLPMLMLSRHSRDESGAPVEWVRSVYRGDRYKFLARLKRPVE
ncbi:hypothetical protein ADL27_59260, partial [Streptomyces sp. NRRL F-6602]